MVNKSDIPTPPSRKRILDAARAEFSEKGFDGARVDSIAQRAEVNKALIYYYFKSKDELLQELLRTFLEDRRRQRPTQGPIPTSSTSRRRSPNSTSSSSSSAATSCASRSWKT